MAGREMMLRLDLDQDPWRRIFGLKGPFSLVLLELNSLDAATVPEYLTPPERKYFTHFTQPKRKKEWLGGRIAAKQAAQSMACSDAGHEASPWLALEVAADQDGRPFLRAIGDPGRILPDISISHSQGLAAAMAVKEGYCGIDIQKVTPSVMRISERFAGDAEMTILNTLTGDWPKAGRLTLLWAAKEALKKAIGTRRLPGFMSIRLIGTNADNCAPVGDYFVFDFSLPNDITISNQGNTVSVAVLFHEGYGLAFTGVAHRYLK